MVTAARAGEDRRGGTRQLADDPFHCVTFWHLHTCSTSSSGADLGSRNVAEHVAGSWNSGRGALSVFIFT